MRISLTIRADSLPSQTKIDRHRNSARCPQKVHRHPHRLHPRKVRRMDQCHYDSRLPHRRSFDFQGWRCAVQMQCAFESPANCRSSNHATRSEQVLDSQLPQESESKLQSWREDEVGHSHTLRMTHESLRISIARSKATLLLLRMIATIHRLAHHLLWAKRDQFD